MKILVHAPNWIGDAVLALPAIRGLAEGNSNNEIWIAARDWVRDVYAGEKFLAGSLSLPKAATLKGVRRTVADIKRHSFDAGILVTNSFASALLFSLGGIPERWGYSRSGRRILLTRAVPYPPPLPKRHQVFFYQNLMTELGFPASGSKLHLTVNPEEKQTAQDFLARRGIDASKPLVILNPGAYYGPAKRWPPEKYAWLCEQLQANAHIAVIGSAAEKPLAEAIRKEMSRPPVIITGETNLRLLAGILNAASLCVTNDSGPMHLANAVKTPVIALFGPTDPDVTRPFQPPSAHIHKKPVCWPCSYRECPFDHRCMEALSPAEVFGLCREFLG